MRGFVLVRCNVSLRIPTVLRFNVEDIRSAAHVIEAKGVALELLSFEWGDIGVFTDSDGNRCELKNAA
jgi:lactoylglutathione lyase